MKDIKRRILFIALLLIFTLSLSACNQAGGLFKKEWENADFNIFDGNVFTWNSDEESTYRTIVDGIDLGSDPNEYKILNFDDTNEHSVQFVKEKQGKSYYSDTFTVSEKIYSQQTVTSVEELTSLSSNGSIVIGSLKYDHFIFDFTSSANSVCIPYEIYANSSIEKISIKGLGQTISNFTLNVNERTAPLTIIFENVTLTVNSNYMINYSGSSKFDTTIIMLGKNSFSNTRNGDSGSNGSSSSGLTTAERGGNGENGGGLFSLPKVKLFTQSTPSFFTGSGGNGGNGGNCNTQSAWGQLAHGGDGGHGGNGGSAFYSSEVICFNASYEHLSGTFGHGGNGGSGGDGITDGSNGTNGTDGRLLSSGIITYLSRTDGKTPTTEQSPTISPSFNATYLNGYMVWNQQTGATSYQILANNTIIDTVSQNCCYIPNTISLSGKTITVKAICEGKTLVSYPVKIFDDSQSKPLSTSNSTLTVTGAEYVTIDATTLNAVHKINVESSVKRLSIINNNSDRVTLNLNIIASARTENLILDLHNVKIVGYSSEATITFNNGKFNSLESDPMLIINGSENSQVFGKEGQNGANGTKGGLFQKGSNGGNGGNGYDAINSALVCFMGENIAIYGGNGGNGGTGGDGNGNDGGNGGNGGNGGTALCCNTAYLVLDEPTYTVDLNAGAFGSFGLQGSSTLVITSAKNGVIGSKGKTTNGTIIKYSGTIS